jgi:hypothetical protein
MIIYGATRRHVLTPVSRQDRKVIQETDPGLQIPSSTFAPPFLTRIPHLGGRISLALASPSHLFPSRDLWEGGPKTLATA